jgi:acetyl esterase/lipase
MTESGSSLRIDDVEYARRDGRPLLARVYRPSEGGPYPGVVAVHGGAWLFHDRTADAEIYTHIAESGAVVVSVDFRLPPAAGYPTSIADINYAIRWVKSNAETLGIAPGDVGVIGVSSGGHQAILAAMRPDDPRYAELDPGVEDARVCFAVLCWPVIDPLGRYEYAKEFERAGRNPAGLVDPVLGAQDAYWGDEAAMAEGSPVRILERGEKPTLVPVLYVQSEVDIAHPREQLERFVQLYRDAGGEVELVLVPGEPDRDPETPAPTILALAEIVDFVHRRSADA